MMVVTHEISFAREVADTVSVMDHGVVLESGPPSQIFDAPRRPRTREFLQALTLHDSSTITDRSIGRDISR